MIRWLNDCAIGFLFYIGVGVGRGLAHEKWRQHKIPLFLGTTVMDFTGQPCLVVQRQHVDLLAH